jgi:hypothetical protein
MALARLALWSSNQRPNAWGDKAGGAQETLQDVAAEIGQQASLPFGFDAFGEPARETEHR